MNIVELNGSWLIEGFYDDDDDDDCYLTSGGHARKRMCQESP